MWKIILKTIYLISNIYEKIGCEDMLKKEKIFNLPRIETKRCILRKFTKNDIDDLYEYASDNEVTQFLSWDTYKSINMAVDYIENVLLKYSKNEIAPWGIEWIENSKLIGSIDFVKYDEKNFSAEIGYVLNKKYWNKGIMTEVLKEIVEFGFDEMNLVRIETRLDSMNVASERVMQKNGLKYEGTLRKKEFLKNKFIDVKYYSILKDEYYK